MFFNFNTTGELFNINSKPLFTDTPTVVTLHGEATYDGVHARNIEMDNDDILDISTEEAYGTNTIWLANFEETLSIGSYASLPDSIYKYIIKRRKSDESQYSDLKEVLASSGESSITDYTAKNNQEYEYAVFPQTEDGTLGNSSSDISSLNFYGWFLTDIDNTVCYKFDMATEIDSLEHNIDYKVFDNYTQYPVTSFGNKNYVSGVVKTIPYTYSSTSGTYTIDLSLLNTLKTFINNGEQKILRNTLGEIFAIITSDFTYKYYDKVPSQPYSISFKFIQIGSGE